MRDIPLKKTMMGLLIPANICTLLVFFCASVLQVSANDGYVLVSQGGVTLQNEKNSTIRMDSEYVEIKLYKNYYTVNATFWLYNTDKETSVQVGFPQEYEDHRSVFFDSLAFKQTKNDDKRVPKFVINNINTFVNDSLVPFKTYYEYNRQLQIEEKKLLFSQKEIENWWEKKGKHLQDDDRFLIIHKLWLNWYVKSVFFPHNVKVKTSVSFKSSYNYNDPDRYGKYIFGSGSSWKSNIIKSVFLIKKVEKDSSVLKVDIDDKYDKNLTVKRIIGIDEERLEFNNYKPDISDEIQFNLIELEE